MQEPDKCSRILCDEPLIETLNMDYIPDKIFLPNGVTEKGWIKFLLGCMQGWQYFSYV